MKRVTVALLALTGLLLPALFGRADEAGAQAARGPSFIAAAATWTLDDRSDGSTTAIAIGTPPVRAGTIGGGTDACALSETNGQYANPSDDPADFIEPDTAGATAVNRFAVDAASCAITWTGTRTEARRTDGTLEAYSLTVTVSDGVDAGGSADASVDDTMRVTVKIVNVATDRAALNTFYTATGGSGWTDDANWSPPAADTPFSHTFELTAAATVINAVGYYGISSPAVGAIRNSSGNVTPPDGATYEISALTVTGTTLDLALTPTTAGALAADAAADFRCFFLRVATTLQSVSVNLDSPSVAGEQSGRYHWQWTAPANLLTTTTGDFDATLSARDWFPGWAGVSAPGCGRVTGLDLSNNGLSGTIPAALAELSALTSLDLSDNADLTGSIPAALLAHTGLTTLNLRGTGVCADPDDAALSAWLAAIRARAGGSALVPVCGAGGPSFPRLARGWTLNDGADGSTTAIAIGTPSFTAGTSGGTDACALSATNGQYANPSDDPADFIEPDTAGATAVNVFAVAPATCAITYTGSGATRAEGTLEAYSLTVTISDGVDAAGATDARVDDTIRVTVRILSAATDREALDKFYTATGGDGWTNGANWNEGPVTETATLHTFELTAGTGSGFVGYNSSVGSVRNDSGTTPPIGGTAYRVTTLTHFGTNLMFRVNPASAGTAFGCLSLRVAGPTNSDTVAFASPTDSRASLGDWQFRWGTVTAGLFQTGEDFDAELRGPRTFDDWHGVTTAPPCEGGRATAIDLRDNGLTGNVPADLAELTALTSLDLSDNAGLTGGIPAALLAHTGLTTLDLRGTGVCVERDDAAVNGWLATIRAKASGSALVPICGVKGPSFTRESFTAPLDEGAAGSPTPVAIGTPARMAGTAGGTAACALSATNGQYANPSAAPADFIEPDTAGATAVSLFTVDAASCAITYTGPMAERTAGALEAYSLTVTVSDGVDTAGAPDARVDDSIKVTVAILNVDTDRAALEAFYDAAGGDRWANRANWKESDVRDYPLVHTFKLTAAVGPGLVPYRGYDGGTNTGAVRESSNRADLDGGEHEVIHLSLGGSGGDTVTLIAQPAATAAQAFRCYHLQIGTTRLSFADALVTPSFTSVTFQWGGQATDLIQVGDFEARLHSTGTFGDWAGVRTDGCGRVTRLCPAGCYSDVSNVLRGSLPPELGQLSRLTFLRINGLPDQPRLDLSGGIPPELGNLRNLTQLWIVRTTLSGAVPPELAGLRNLDRLYLHDNAFSGALPDLRGLGRLRQLHAQNNRLSAFPTDGGTFEPTSATTYGWTARCNVGHQRSQGQFLATPEQAAAPASAWITARCGAGGGASSATSATTYGWTATCDSGAGSGSGSDIATPWAAASAAREWLADCPAHWPPNLQDLRLSNNAFRGDAPELKSLSGLRFLHLDRNRLSAFPARWPDNLWDLHLNDNAFTGAIPSNLSRLSDLQNLYLQNNQLSGPIPGSVNLLSNIQRLRLDGNRLTGPIQNYGTLWRLREMRLNDNQLDGGIPANLNLLRQLQRLHLGNNRLTGTIPATLNDLTALFELDLSGNDLEGAIPDLRDTRMSFLSLADNRLTVLPPSLGQLDRMTALHLHGNRFAEGIPNLGGATRMERLTLNGNSFSGGIPDWLSTLTSLTQLDLSDNKLDGRVPTDLSELTALTHLDLSENRLNCAGASILRNWINGIRRAGGTASVDICAATPGVPSAPGGGGGGPVIGGAAPVAYLVITVRTEGDAPRGSVYALSIRCDSGSYAVELLAGQSHTAGVSPGGTCTLAVTNRQGAIEVRGEFANQVFGAGVSTATVTMAYPATAEEEEEEEMDEEEEEERDEVPESVRELDAELVVGRTLVSWTGGETPVASVVEALTLRVTAIHRWDGTTQTWRSWFPGGDAIGVNSFFAFEPGGIYFIFAEEREDEAPDDGEEASGTA